MIAALALAAAMLNPDVRPQTVGATICRPHWTASIRPPRRVTRAYERRHLPAGADPRAFVVDHRVSLGLGGAPGEPNLQLQTVADARRKDRIEAALHRAVCSGRIGLRQAQEAIAR